MLRKHFLFYGRVQGVGFRYQVMYAARTNNLTGWVRNLSDGSVEMEVQGKAQEIDELLLCLFHLPLVEIERMEEKDLKIRWEKGFRVKG